MGEGQAERPEGAWICRSSSLSFGGRGDLFPPKSYSLFPSPPCPLAWQEPEQQAKVCRFFFPPSQAAFSWPSSPVPCSGQQNSQRSTVTQHPGNWEWISRQPSCSKGRLKDRAQFLPCLSWAVGAKTGGSRQAFRQEAALGECGLIPLLSPSLNDHRLEGILKKKLKGRHFTALSPWLWIFKGIWVSRKRFFYSAQAMHSQQSPFLVPSFHLPDPFLPIPEPHLAFLKAKPQKKKK